MMINFLKKLLSPPTIPSTSAGLSDVGRVRKNNEDSFAIFEEKKMCVVADGMGGHKAGEVASRTTIEILRHHFSRTILSAMQVNPQETKHAMVSCFEKANTTIMDLGAEDPDLHGMGCTLVMTFINGNTLHVCHVGDARCYLASGGVLKQITTDHTALVEMKNKYPDTSDVAEQLQTRHVVTRVIGYSFPEPPEYNAADLQEGDRILLCSDGLWSMLDEQQIYTTITEANAPDKAAEELVAMANEAGGSDNITALLTFC
jgi:serine/threonine protein phosphatase PrpC